MTELLFRNRQAPGDVLMLTAMVRDLHKQYPGQFITDIFTNNRESLWIHNPYITTLDPGKVRNINVKYGKQILKSDTSGQHFVAAFHESVGQQLGINITPTELRPDIYFTEEERANPPIKGDYWIVVAGNKSDIPTKMWGNSRYQQVIDALKDEVAFVQVGGGPERKRPSHFHKPLDGILDIIGKTGFRQLMHLVLHAKGVLCGVTCAMHLAAAVNVPCVVIAGGREHPMWECYDSSSWIRNGMEPPADLVEHTFFHTMGKLNCCFKKGCWRAGLGDMPLRRDNTDPNCRQLITTGSELTPACLDMIKPEMVVNAIRDYKTPRSSVKDLEIDFVPDPLSVESTRVLKAEKRTIASTGRRGVMLEKTGNPTICVLLYGEYVQLHRRCINSILVNTPKDKYKLIVGCNEVNAQTLEWLGTELPRVGVDHEVIIEAANTYKYPLMRKMFERNDSNWLIWFDDDSHIVDNPEWLQQTAAFFQPGLNAGYHCFGKTYYYHLKTGQINWVKSAKWYKGREFRQNKGHDTIDFCTGGFWAISTIALKALDWPDPRINHNGGDIMLGAALYQNELGMQQIKVPGITISNHKRRGFREIHPGIVAR